MSDKLHSATAAPQRPHLVWIDRRGEFSSPTMPAALVQRFQSVFRRRSWWLDRWSARTFRDAVSAELPREAPSGAVFISTGVKLDPPPPFDEFFEPIPFELAFGGDLENRLRDLSGQKPTREERMRPVGMFIVGLVALLTCGGLAFAMFQSHSIRIVFIVLAMVLLNGLILAIIFALLRLRGKWHLIPGGVAIVRRYARPMRRLTLLTPRDAVATLRYVSTGKTVILTLTLWTYDGKRYAAGVSQRQALGFLAAWQSSHPPPSERQVREVLGLRE